MVLPNESQLLSSETFSNSGSWYLRWCRKVLNVWPLWRSFHVTSRAQVAVDPVVSLHQSCSVACEWSVRHQIVLNRATADENEMEPNPIKMSYTCSDTCKQGKKHTKGENKSSKCLTRVLNFRLFWLKLVSYYIGWSLGFFFLENLGGLWICFLVGWPFALSKEAEKHCLDHVNIAIFCDFYNETHEGCNQCCSCWYCVNIQESPVSQCSPCKGRGWEGGSFWLVCAGRFENQNELVFSCIYCYSKTLLDFHGSCLGLFGYKKTFQNALYPNK